MRAWGAHYTRHVEQEARIIEIFFAQYLRKNVPGAALIEEKV
jgi:hypothetical protein